MNKQLTENKENEKHDFKALKHVSVNEAVDGLDFDHLKTLGFKDIETRIDTLIRRCKIYATETAVLLTVARDKFDKTKQWLNWAKGITGADERRVYQLLSVGRMILDRDAEFFEKVKEVDSLKLMILARADQGTQDAILEDYNGDLNGMSRDLILTEVTERTDNPEQEASPKSVEAAKAQSAFEKWLKIMRTFGKIDAKTAAGIAVESSPEELINAGIGILGTLEVATQSGKFDGYNVNQFVAELVKLTTALIPPTTPTTPKIQG